ncbi:MAG: GTPase Era [Bacillales bacterium]|nr:GTPase Era [Bacillales bacterium]
MKSGFVGVVGRPNAGKSTLINSIVGKKVAITSNKPQTTRNIIHGIYNEEDTQIVFVDTPGIHKPNHKLGTYLNRQAFYSMDDTDIVLVVVDASEDLGRGDKFIVDKLKDINKPVILVLNKIDKIKKENVLLKIDEYSKIYNFSEIVPVSALKNNNTNELVKVIKKYLKDEVRYYGEDDYTNKSTEFLISEIVREKIFNKTSEEIPHSLTCIVEHIETKKDKYIINVVVIVDRDSVKKIVIGKGGNLIKEVGIEARKDLELLLGKKVYLELFVKVIKKWRDKEKYLNELGFKEFE